MTVNEPSCEEPLVTEHIDWARARAEVIATREGRDD
jgi:hypothetical protein